MVRAVRSLLGAAFSACSHGTVVSSPCAFSQHITGPVTLFHPQCARLLQLRDRAPSRLAMAVAMVDNSHACLPPPPFLKTTTSWSANTSPQPHVQPPVTAPNRLHSPPQPLCSCSGMNPHRPLPLKQSARPLPLPPSRRSTIRRSRPFDVGCSQYLVCDSAAPAARPQVFMVHIEAKSPTVYIVLRRPASPPLRVLNFSFHEVAVSQKGEDFWEKVPPFRCAAPGLGPRGGRDWALEGSAVLVWAARGKAGPPPPPALPDLQSCATGGKQPFFRRH